MKKYIKLLIWLYIALLIVEGALRKWLLPSLADPLLIVRDPVVLAIYGLAIAGGFFPVNRFVIAIGILAVLSAVASILGGHHNLIVIAYGIRINYLHLPLIWVMGRVLDRRDVERIGAFLLLTAIPMMFIMVQQFRSPMDSFINHGVGNDEVGQIFGADGRIRPPGLFAFITGPQLFFPLCAAFFFDEIGGAKRLPWYLLIPCGLAIAIALPVSISRTVMLGTAVVALTYFATRPFTSVKISSLMRPLLLLAFVAAALSQLPVFKEGTSVFMMRWDTAEEQSGGSAWGGVMQRTVNGFTNPYFFMKAAPFLGHGIGTGSNVGARLTSGSVGFSLAEEEWGKVLLELGPLLGMAFIILRIALTGWFAVKGWSALRRDKNPLPLLILSGAALSIMQGQWAPPTVLGFAVVSGGLLLGSLNHTSEKKRETVVTSDHGRKKTSRPSNAPLPVDSDRRLPSILRVKK